MERTKRQRIPKRAGLTRTFHEVDVELAKDEPDREILQEKLRKLNILETEINELDTRILDHLLDNNAPEEEYVEESRVIEEYYDGILRAKVRIASRLDAEVPPVIPVNEGSVHGSAASGERRRNFKLPKIELRKFSGDLREWLGWWAQFKKIHEDEELHATDKFAYLIQSLTDGSRPRRVVEGYPQTEENYNKAVAALQDRFGDKTILTEFYVRQLSRLVIKNASKTNQLSLSLMYDDLDSSLRALDSLGVTMDQSAAFLYPLVESSLPEELLRVWQRSALSGYGSDDEDDDEERGVDHRLKSLMTFLKREVKGAERLAFVHAGVDVGDRQKKQRMAKSPSTDCPTAAGLVSTQSNNCLFCDKQHESRDCGRATSMSLEERKEKVIQKRCCFACLRPGHSAKKCRTFVKCIVCQRKHYPLLCPGVSSASAKDQSSSSNVNSAMTSVSSSGTTVLQTLKVRVHGEAGSCVVRALIDSGAQRSYLKTSTADQISAKTIKQQELMHNVFGGGCTQKKVHNILSVKLSPLEGSSSVVLELLTQDTICNALPPVPTGPWLQKLRRHGIHLSDVKDGGGEIEVLLGSDSIAQILTGVTRRIDPHLIALETKLGWTVMGRIQESEDKQLSGMVIASYMNVNEIEKLWKLETIGINDPIQTKSEEERQLAAKTFFEETVTQHADGRYEVALPWREKTMEIPTNKAIATCRLRSATAKLNKEGKYAEYNNIFLDWHREGLIETVPTDLNTGHYLPHRPVFKPESMTTPVRPVFDASCKDKRSPSLNDLLETGPNFLELIPSIINRFRIRKVGAVADIRKAFQMVSVRKEDRDFLKFLWWDNWGNIITYRHARVPFGVSSSPFLLAAALNHHFSKANPEFRNTTAILSKSLYVDNVVASFNSVDDYEYFRVQSVSLLAEARMELRQWEYSAVEETRVGQLTGNRRGLESGSSTSLKIEETPTTSVLGLRWDKKTDTLCCVEPEVSPSDLVTKRTLLSTIAKVFDPMGFLSPAMLLPKLLLQDSFVLKFGWDKTLPDEFIKKFDQWRQQLHLIKKICIPRYVEMNNEDSNQLHIFCDASMVAYAAAVFLRVTRGEEVMVHLIQSKARVAPKKAATIPRLELLSCLIGARLGNNVAVDVEVPLKKYYWTDSTTALAWIRRDDTWGTFVGNRVREINKLTSAAEWNHVPGVHNPADLASRGCTFADLIQRQWWRGPEWLRRPRTNWPCGELLEDEEAIASEKKKSVTTLTSLVTTAPWYVKSSNYITNVRVVAWIRRFITNTRRGKLQHGDLSVEEVIDAEKVLFRLVQQQVYQASDTTIHGVRVSMGEDELLRVTTKLLYKKDSEHFRRPVILPFSHPLTEQLIRYTHIEHGHAGVQFLMGRLREKVWIVGGRRAIKAVLTKCIICRRYSVKPTEVEEAPLPKDRVEPVAAFHTTGIDLAGPLFLKNGEKVWVVLFTCAVFRAVHLELVGSLSTDAFLFALQKFICRRGRPHTIWSDNGTNFRGANEAAKKLDWRRIQRETSTSPIRWKFIPPTAAWWGGWWERLIRSLKDQLRKMLGHSKVNRIQLESLLCEVESSLNGRPLTYVTEDQDDLIPLSPEMFLHDLSSSAIPEVNAVDGHILRQSKLNLQKLREELRQRFRKEYLGLLVHIGKMRKTKPLQVGDVVLVGADGKKRLTWPMGRIIELIAGSDGKVRVAKVKVKEGVLTRPLQRLFPLEVSSQDTPFLKKNNTVDLESKQDDQLKTRYGRRVVKPNYFTFN